MLNAWPRIIMCRRLRDGNPWIKGQLEDLKTRWEDDVLEDIKSMNVCNWKKVGQNRDSWKKVVEQARILRLRWSRGSVLAFSTQVRGFKPDRSRRIFKGEKILSTPSFGRQVKPSVPCRRFAEWKRTLNVPWKSCI
jgi:hypothetical protein